MIDDIDRRLISALAEDARLSVKDLAARVGLSSPSVSDRLRRLEERGVIQGFSVDVALEPLGYTLQAIVRVKPLPGKLYIVQNLLSEIPEVIECDKVTGDDCFIVRLVLRSIAQLDEILDRIIDKAQTSTSIVKSQTVKRRLPPL
ncbi:asnC family protein [Asticcacaulis biprosthecium C19]|uniref:AsnC family protein n=1 Tax=Asticcacaulis biprosthecium C19 TaxID=715226 RepID=F4QSE0_9CAUL|nr:Lrp/AsnC family transcriptional regulator [Asticcacaulis biprosthecium]EGF89660.1 asnC family protein [Asticcacaulis biprosthecium C19]